MAGKPKHYDYYFQLISPIEIKLTKTDPSGDPIQTYTLKGNLETGDCFCDCPAGLYRASHSNEPHKHQVWVQRYIAIHKQATAPDCPIFYSSKDDAFYPIPGFGVNELKKLLEPGTEPSA